jgi:hypothetical protein
MWNVKYIFDYLDEFYESYSMYVGYIPSIWSDSGHPSYVAVDAKGVEHGPYQLFRSSEDLYSPKKLKELHLESLFRFGTPEEVTSYLERKGPLTPGDARRAVREIYQTDRPHILGILLRYQGADFPLKDLQIAAAPAHYAAYLREIDLDEGPWSLADLVEGGVLAFQIGHKGDMGLVREVERWWAKEGEGMPLWSRADIDAAKESGFGDILAVVSRHT